LHIEEMSILDGALKFRDMVVQDVMTPVVCLYIQICVSIYESIYANVHSICMMYIYIYIHLGESVHAIRER
jgi:CBS domain containing-hemolysin-like protein